MNKNIPTLGLFQVYKNWNTNNGAKIGTIAGASILGGSGGLIGGLIGATQIGATIGTMILPGAGTIIGGIGGAFIGITVSGFVGTIVGSELGKQLDPKRSFLDRHDIEIRIEKDVFLQRLEKVLEYNKGVVESLFHQFDKEGKDVIQAKHLKRVLLNLGIYINQKESDILLKEMKKEEMDEITFNEFEEKFKESLNSTILRNRVAILFQMYDLDQTGKMNYENFIEFYEILTFDFYEKPLQTEIVFKRLSKENYIQLNDFVHWITEILTEIYSKK